MIKVLVAALVGTIIGIVVMVAVIAIAGTDTSGASSVGLGALPNSTFTPSGSSRGSHHAAAVQRRVERPLQLGWWR